MEKFKATQKQALAEIGETISPKKQKLFDTDKSASSINNTQIRKSFMNLDLLIIS